MAKKQFLQPPIWFKYEAREEYKEILKHEKEEMAMEIVILRDKLQTKNGLLFVIFFIIGLYILLRMLETLV